MAILLDKNSRVLVQGFTGREGTFHASQMIAYGTEVVGGVTPGKGGQIHLDRPVFDTVKEAVKYTKANVALIFVPAAVAAGAIVEAALAEIPLIICITEGIPINEMIRVKAFLKTTESRLIGPNCPGIISPGKAKAGIMPAHIHQQGKVGVISRSGTLTYVAVQQITEAGLGQSTCVGIGGDPIIGSQFLDILPLFEQDRQTEAVVLIGEIGGSMEEQAADYIKEKFSKPVFAFIAGRTAPEGRRMGHAGAIISGGKGTAADKINYLRAAGIEVVENLAEIGSVLKARLGD